MKIKLTMLALCLLGSLITFSQTDYPKTIELNGDTVTIFTFSQAKLLAKELVEKDYLIIRSQLDSIDLDIMNNILSNIDKLNSSKNSIIEDYKLIVENQKQVITLQEQVIKDYSKSTKRRKWRNAGIITGIAGGLITTLVLTNN